MALSGKWKATMDAALSDSRSSAYDATIQAELDDDDKRFAQTPGYATLTPKLFKAVALVESGGPSNPAWTARVMQIGNPGDPGYGVLKRQEQNSGITMSQQLQADLLTKSIDEPTLNVRAGIALILTMAAKFSASPAIDPSDGAMRTHKVGKGDSLSRIARSEGTTMQDLRQSNPGLAPSLHPGQSLNFHHAHMVTQIAGWRTIDADFVADRYNGGGDPAYAEKLGYVMGKL
jgi:hypothetical protein